MMEAHLRASDADREQAVTTLRAHVAAGRLSLDEFSERCASAYAARTAGDLAALSTDLPPAGKPEPIAPPVAVDPGRRRLLLAAFAVAALAGAALIGGVTEMAAAAGSMAGGGCP